MPSNDDKKTILMVTVSLAILTVFALIFIWSGKIPYFQKSETSGPAELPIITPIITQALEGQTAEGLPQDFPLNGKTKITESYSATYPNSTAKQATVVFDSSKTPKQNYDFYSKWAKDNQWNTINQSDEEALKSLYLKKGIEDVNITITKESITISYVKF